MRKKVIVVIFITDSLQLTPIIVVNLSKLLIPISDYDKFFVLLWLKKNILPRKGFFIAQIETIFILWRYRVFVSYFYIWLNSVAPLYRYNKLYILYLKLHSFNLYIVIETSTTLNKLNRTQVLYKPQIKRQFTSKRFKLKDG